MTFRELLERLQEHAQSEYAWLDREVVVRLSTPLGEDDHKMHVGRLHYITIDAAGNEELALVIDALQDGEA